MPVEIQGALPSAVGTEDVVAGPVFIRRRLHDAVVEPETVQFELNAVSAFAIVIARWILARNTNQILAKVRTAFLRASRACAKERCSSMKIPPGFQSSGSRAARECRVSDEWRAVGA